MNKVLITKSKSFKSQLSFYLNSRNKDSNSKKSIVRKILRSIKEDKDAALIRYEKKFSGVKKLNKAGLFFSKNEIKKNIKILDKKTKKDIELAYNRILNFHKNQKINTFSTTDKFKNSF